MAEKSTGNLLAGVGYSSADGSCSTRRSRSRTSSARGNALTLAINTSTDQPHDLARRSPSRTGRWTASRARSSSTRRTSTRRRWTVSQYTSSTLGGGDRLRHPDLRDRHHQLRLPRRAHRVSTLFDNSPPVYYQFVQDFGYSTNSYIVSGGWSRDTRDDILYPSCGRLQSALSRWGCRSATLRTTSSSTSTSRSGRVYGDFVLMLRGGHGLRRWLQRQAAAVLQGVLRGRRGLGARLPVRLARAARHLRQHAGRQAQDRRQRRAVLPHPEGRASPCASQRASSTRARST